jgi:hypothetical protein
MKKQKRNREQNSAMKPMSARSHPEHGENGGEVFPAAPGEAVPAEKDTLDILLRSELDKLDRLSEPEIPGGDWFERMVVQGKRESRRKLVRDLTLFWLSALGILTVYAAITLGRPGLFLAIQLAAVAAVPFVIMAALRRKRVTGRD